MMASGRFNLRAACVHPYGNVYVREFQAHHSSQVSIAITEYPESHHLWRVKVYLAQSLRSCGKSRVGQLHRIRVSCYHVFSVIDTWSCQGCVHARDKHKRHPCLITACSQWQSPALEQRPSSLSMTSHFLKVPPPLCTFALGTKVPRHEPVGSAFKPHYSFICNWFLFWCFYFILP